MLSPNAFLSVSCYLDAVLRLSTKCRKSSERCMIMDSTFVRKDFYISPPNQDASEEEWNNWLRADNRKAAVEKAQHTRKMQQSDLPDEYQGNSIRRVNGVWRQTTAVGLSGDFDSSNGGTVEPTVEPEQERLLHLHRLAENTRKRGTNTKGRSAARHRKRRQLKKSRKASKRR